MPRLYVTPEAIDTVATLLVVGIDRVTNDPGERDDVCALIHDALDHVIESITPELPSSVGKLCEALRDALATTADIDAFAPVVVSKPAPAGWLYVD